VSGMTAILILLGALALGPLAVRYGVDSRRHEPSGRNRPNWS
jgi:hypothetical protein